ncbi:MAG: isoamylase early set domain-containing protein [SAR324 cluster bacterium]|nr:isoamylase early set domain-containing protein [SAR324 cluster bacterium]
MSIKKTYFKSKPTCRLTFRLREEEVRGARAVNLVGEFNMWNTQKTRLKQLKNGDFKIELELDKGKEYQFRYLIDQTRWTNDPEADKTAYTPFPDTINSVVVT